MYTILEKIFKIITYFFRVIQFLFLLYFLLYVIYWFLLIGRIPIAHFFDSWYDIPLNITNWILAKKHISFSNEYIILKLDVLTSVFLTMIALILYNFIFIPLGRIERFFVENSYDKGEKEIPEL